MSVKGAFSKMMPFLSIGLGMAGPMGVVAANVLTNALGVPIKPNSESMTEAITDASLTSDGLERLKQAELQYQAQMTKMGFDHVEDIQSLADSDVASARQRQEVVKDRMPTILAISACLLFAGALAMLKFGLIESGKDAMLLLLGVLGKIVSDVYAYYFGSSRGSDDKSAVIAEIAKAP